MYLFLHGKIVWVRSVVEHQDVSALLRNGGRNDLKKGRRCRAELVRGPKLRAPNHEVLIYLRDPVCIQNTVSDVNPIVELTMQYF